MTRSPTSRSGRPLGAAGPLASALIAGLTAVGLGCAAVGASATTAPVPSSAAESIDREGQATTGFQTLELRRTSENTAASSADSRAGRRGSGNAAPEEPADTTPPASTKAVPQPPVVDASPRKPASRRAAQPVRIRVDAVDLDVEVRATGVADDGSMQLPETVRRAGWYRYSATPSSEVGTTVIAAHVDTRAEGLGPFARLAGLRKGDRVVITDRAGSEHTYRVRSRKLVSRTRLPVDDLFDRNGSPRLVMITCGGAYDARNGYRDNVVVQAEPDP